MNKFYSGGMDAMMDHHDREILKLQSLTREKAKWEKERLRKNGKMVEDDLDSTTKEMIKDYYRYAGFNMPYLFSGYYDKDIGIGYAEDKVHVTYKKYSDGQYYFANKKNLKIDLEDMIKICNLHKHKELCKNHMTITPCCNEQFDACFDKRCEGDECGRRYSWNDDDFYHSHLIDLNYLDRVEPIGYIEQY